MRLAHFEALSPICPACRSERGEDHRLFVAVEIERSGDDVEEGLVQCPSCRREYPILDGIPLLVPDVRGYLASQLHHLSVRDDLSAVIEGMLGEASGQGSPFDAARTQISSYAWDHYGEFDPGTAPSAGSGSPPGAVTRALDVGLAVAADAGLPFGAGPLLDVGCGPGRATLRLADSMPGLVLGADLGFHLLRIASRVLRHGAVRYPLRRTGVRYDRREFPVPVGASARVDFWACDGVNLPFTGETFAGAVGLNLIDCVYSPIDLLRSLARVLRPGAPLVLTAPYDWTTAATPIEAWIGGHSPRSLGEGDGDAVLRALLTPGGHPAAVAGLELRAERDDLPWSVRLHDRSSVSYRLHLVVAVRQ